MASLNLAPEELKQLELMRNRFLQLTNSLNSLMRDVFSIHPLPSGESLQASATILQHTIKSIQDITNENADLFQRVVIHPSTNFPGRTQENALLTLLRKKLEPDVEHWVEDARDAARAAGIDASKLGRKRGTGGHIDEDDDNDDDAYGYDPDAQGDDAFNEQWGDVREACMEGIMDYIKNQAGEPYTVAEREMGTQNVRTGLKRSLEEEEEYEDDSEEEEEDEDEKMEEDLVEVVRPGVGVPSRPLVVGGMGVVGGGRGKREPENMIWWLARGDGNVPGNLDMEYLRKSKEVGKRGPGR